MKKALLLLAICLMVVPALGQQILLDHGLFREDALGAQATNLDAFLPGGQCVARSLPDTVRITSDLANLGVAARKYGMPYAIQPGTETAEDGSARVYFLNSYDLAELYIVVDVTDDYINTASVNPWEDDNVEIFVDFDNSKIVTETPYGWPPDDYDTNDAQIRIVVARDTEGAVTTAVSERTGDDTGNGWTFLGSYTQRCEPFATGYSVMVALPMASFESTVTAGEGTYPIPNGIMGVNIQVTDLDDEAVGDRQTGTLYSPHDYTSPATWGELFLYTFTDISYGTATVDGDASEWDDITTHGLYFQNPGADALTEFSDLLVQWQAMWDEDALYVLTTVLADDALCSLHTNSWERDNIELFVDFNNSKVVNSLPTADGNSEQMRFCLDIGEDGATDSAETAQGASAGGWLCEWAVSWDALGGFPTSEFIGFDVHAGDNDGDGVTQVPRDAVVMWYESHSDRAYTDESVWGTARLVTGQAGVNDWTVLDR